MLLDGVCDVRNWRATLKRGLQIVCYSLERASLVAEMRKPHTVCQQEVGSSQGIPLNDMNEFVEVNSLRTVDRIDEEHVSERDSRHRHAFHGRKLRETVRRNRRERHH